MSLALTILELQARVKSLEARLEDLVRQAAQAPRPAPTARARRKSKPKRKSP